LAEIEKLRNELSFEKKKNSELEKELAYYRNNQGAPSGSENELRSKVAYL
jgi:predicted RNase H-like nuclease (RuvC/YqgF family)